MAYSYEYPYTDPNRSNSDWLLTSMREVIERMDLLDEWKASHEAQYNELKSLYDDLIAGRFPDSIDRAFRDWMRVNAISLVGELVKNVFFGLTDAGYFVAYIPENWSDIIFNTTGLDIVVTGADYGRLVLSY